MKKIFVLMLGLVLMMASITACGSNKDAKSNTSPQSVQNSAQEGKPLRIGVTLLYKGDEWLAAISDEFEKQAAELGYEISVQDGGQDNEKQMQQVENFIAQQYDVIIISAANAEGIIPAVQKAEQAGIPVISIDTPIDYPYVSTCISWDNYETGVTLGEYAKKYIEEHYADKEVVNLVMINAPSYPHLVKRDEGFLSVVSAIEKVNVIATQDANGSRETSANIINNNVAKGIDMVYGVIDNHAWGAVTALEEAKVEKCAVLSCGGFGDEPFTAIQNDHQYYKAIIVIPPTSVVKDCLQASLDVYNAEEVQSIINADFGLADKDTVEKYM